MRKFKTLCNIPGIDIGEIFEETPNGYIHWLSTKHYIGYPKYIIETFADRFEEIKEEKCECQHSKICKEVGDLIQKIVDMEKSR